jgi:predicted membrane metal-binding protein
MKAGGLHEQLERAEEIKGSSDRSFGFTFAAVGAIFALWPLWRLEAPRWWLLAVVAGLVVVSLLVPQILRPVNRVWLKIGLLLNKIVSPIVLGIIFFGLLTPLGALLRIGGKDPLRLRFETDAPSYWIVRQPPGPAPRSMTRQF